MKLSKWRTTDRESYDSGLEALRTQRTRRRLFNWPANSEQQIQEPTARATAHETAQMATHHLNAEENAKASLSERHRIFLKVNYKSAQALGAQRGVLFREAALEVHQSHEFNSSIALQLRDALQQHRHGQNGNKAIFLRGSRVATDS